MILTLSRSLATKSLHLIPVNNPSSDESSSRTDLLWTWPYFNCRISLIVYNTESAGFVFTRIKFSIILCPYSIWEKKILQSNGFLLNKICQAPNLYSNWRVSPTEFNSHKFGFVRYVFVKTFGNFWQWRKWPHNDPENNKDSRFVSTDIVKYTMVAKSDVQLKIKSYSVCEELFIFILNRKRNQSLLN